jgi:NAD(P)-dependent dehydrogenase (short-subunit alcohol dehydrogenase family)
VKLFREKKMRFKDKTVIITGGAGGIGKTAVRLFAREGARVMVADLSEEGCQEICDEVNTQGYVAKYLVGDLGEKKYCEQLVTHTVETFGGLDILINNAGIIPRGTILETTDEMWFAALNINLTAVFYLCRAAIPHMQKQGGGAIVNTSSTWGVYPGPGHMAYCTSKGAVAAMTKNLGRDHAPDNIRVNAVCPNEVNTPMLRTGFAKRGFDPDKAVEQLNKTVPLGRIAEPEDIADVIAFLASDDARYVAGATVEVSGAKPVY